MRMLMLLTLLLLAVPGTALAAPPANDNRAAQRRSLPFRTPSPATTAEATVERLDPQVSRCGRVESTLWYRIDTAPDGLIALSVKGARWRRARSADLPADGPPRSGGRLRVRRAGRQRLRLARGRPRLQLPRARRPPAETPDGGFELRAELFLPPAERQPRRRPGVVKLPGSVRGTTLGATADEADPGRCGLSGATVWYRLPSRRDGRILLRLTAAGQLDAALVVLERVRSRTALSPAGRRTAAATRPSSFASERGATYLIAVGHVAKRRPRDLPDRRARLRGGREPAGGEAPASRAAFARRCTGSPT